ncbi:MAG: L-asparaginase [Natronomonas sp.]|jgi:L-asparaginase
MYRHGQVCSDVLLLENPPEGALVVGKHLPDSLVVHVLIIEFVLQEFVLLADLLFVAHTSSLGPALMNVHHPENRNPQPTPAPTPRMRVHVIATGGTIASTAEGSDSGAAPELSGDDLVEAVPELETYADITVESVASKPGFDMSPGICARVAARMDDLADDVDGFVVTHGTDTLAETARYLDLTTSAPVVVTGAQRRPDERGSDGPTNLLTAVRAAAHERVTSGAFVAFDEELHAAATVRKSHTSSLDTFRSPESGPLARFTRRRIHWHSEPTGDDADLPVPDEHPTVPLVVSASGVGHQAFADAEARADGIVVAGTGLGNTTAALGAAIADADCPVVLASRCHAGPTEPVYGTPGGAATLAGYDHVRFAHGTPWAARIELMLALAADRVDDRFEQFDS